MNPWLRPEPDTHTEGLATLEPSAGQEEEEEEEEEEIYVTSHVADKLLSLKLKLHLATRTDNGAMCGENPLPLLTSSFGPSVYVFAKQGVGRVGGGFSP